MTTLRQAAQQALEALTAHADLHSTMYLKMDAITALRAALAEQPVMLEEHCLWARNGNQPCPHVQQAEPVAWLFTNLQSGDYDFCYQEDDHDHDREMWHKQPLYTAPPQHDPITQPVQWMGCGECDCIFPCYMGAAKCMRLNTPPPAQAADGNRDFGHLVGINIGKA